MAVTAKDLLGAWHLESWSFIHDDGRPAEYPLGADARGIILYTADGHVSATLMRANLGESFAYAGRYEVRDDAVFHSIEVATNPSLVGVTSTRYIELMGERLTLSGPDFSAGTGRTQRIAWRRSG
ncbi:MAG: lipocalin-like domain-containing protein [Alphaproteobacteria bacterium]|nr:lipocalin-like domain-containing protein [Alphaproteobacteria bacterium]